MLTLRVNGSARPTDEPDVLARMETEGRRPVLAVVVEVSEVYFHCGRAVVRSRLWDPAGQALADEVPSAGEIVTAQLGVLGAGRPHRRAAPQLAVCPGPGPRDSSWTCEPCAPRWPAPSAPPDDGSETRTSMLPKVRTPRTRRMITLEVRGTERLSPHFSTGTLGGPELAHLDATGLDQTVRLFFPRDGQDGLWMPSRNSEAWMAELLMMPKSDIAFFGYWRRGRAALG
ncbi:siderophore-interacting protein [Streptomyces ziwulingensis]|uniref:Siderophore-interacting FAD-binding domain-containing protein n=1 Tax=Streptomyces ziwulingensis TaxID=1045501 RepID=A0ABP9BWB5_9ACTN